MSTYNEFSIVNVFPDFSNSQIIVETNFKVDPSSVDLNTVKLYDYDRAQLFTYDLKCDGKKIIINLKRQPVCGLRYFLHIMGIKDALGRVLKTQYNDYIMFAFDVKSKVEIISPASRATYNSRTIDIKLKASDVEDNLGYRIEFSNDSSFFKLLATVKCNESNINNIETEGELITATGGEIKQDVVELQVRIEKEGQIFMRARAELPNNLVGDWSEFISFNIQTISMDSIETTFLEEYLTGDTLFEEESLSPVEITDKSEVGTNEGLLYIEFNKNIKIPKLHAINKDGLIKLGVVTGIRKEKK